jgi:hypothetical protein
MAMLVQFDFTYDGPFGEEMARAFGDLAISITEEPGFLWKIWTENQTTHKAGGIYLFTDEVSAQAYVKKHTERLASSGIEGVDAKVFNVNAALTQITQGPLPM